MSKRYEPLLKQLMLNNRSKILWKFNGDGEIPFKDSILKLMEMGDHDIVRMTQEIEIFIDIPVLDLDNSKPYTECFFDHYMEKYKTELISLNRNKNIKSILNN